MAERQTSSVARPRIVLKLGGELLERPDDVARVAAGIARLAAAELDR